jgi:ketosteroid isomerase-like protein
MSIQHKDIERQIVALENEWMDAWLRHDLETCTRILSDDFQLTSALSSGELTDKAGWLRHAGADFQGTSFSFDKTLVRVYGDAAVVNAWYHQKAMARGQDWSGDFLITDVWVRHGDTWQVVARHSSRPVKGS